VFVVKAWLEFTDQAQAQDAYNQLEARAVNTSVADIGTGRARQSYALLEDQTTDTPVRLEFFYKDRFNIVRTGEPDLTDPPLWIQPAGAQDAYPLLDAGGNPTRVTFEGQVWENTGSDANIWSPLVFGWTLVE